MDMFYLKTDNVYNQQYNYSQIVPFSVYTTSTLIKTVDYLGDVQYEDDVLQFLATGEGRVLYDNTGDTYTYQYFLKDHLGNNRITVQEDGNGDAEIVQEEEYYPFGLTFNSYIGTTENMFKTTGKELQDEHGLNWSSFKWRNADIAIGRFHSVDPLAESYTHNSPYAFSENRVTDGVELEGLEFKRNDPIGEFFGGDGYGNNSSYHKSSADYGLTIAFWETIMAVTDFGLYAEVHKTISSSTKVEKGNVSTTVSAEVKDQTTATLSIQEIFYNMYGGTNDPTGYVRPGEDVLEVKSEASLSVKETLSAKGVGPSGIPFKASVSNSTEVVSFPWNSDSDNIFPWSPNSALFQNTDDGQSANTQSATIYYPYVNAGPLEGGTFVSGQTSGGKSQVKVGVGADVTISKTENTKVVVGGSVGVVTGN